MSKVSASPNSSILKAKEDWQKAYERGDQAGMNAAHDQAEKARKNGGIITVDHSIEDARRIVQNESYKANNPSYSVPAPAKTYPPPKTKSSSVTISAQAPTNSGKSSSSSSSSKSTSSSTASSSSSKPTSSSGSSNTVAAATGPDLNSQLVEAKKEWWNAKERNDTQAMAAAEAKGKQLRQKGAVETATAKQLDLDNQLKDTKQQWWDAKFKGDTKAMAYAEANGSQLRKQGASESVAAKKIDQDNQTKANNLNKQLEAAKQEWWNAKERNDTKAMAAAEAKGKQLRQNGAVETAAAKQMDLDNQLKDAKQQWWDAKFKGDTKAMADAEANGSQLRKQGASETAAAQKIDQDNQTKANNLNKQLEATKQEWWNAKFKGDAQAMATAEAKGKQLRSQGAEETAAAKQMDLDNRLYETKQSWWDAKFRHDANGMANAEASGQQLKQQGAGESESTRKLDASNTQKSDQLNSKLGQVKDQWWDAKFRHDSKGMADAEIKAQQLRDQGAEETQFDIQQDAANREKSDKLNGQLFDLKQQWWVARNINDAQTMADVERQAKQLRDQGAEDTADSLAYDDRMNKSLILNELIKRGGVEAEDARHLLDKMAREEQRVNQRTYLNGLLQNSTSGNQAWAKTEISQMDKEDARYNQREYLQYTVKHGTAGEAAWAKAQLSNMARQDQRDNERIFLQKLMSEGGNGEWAKENIKLLDREEARENQSDYLDSLIQNGSKGEAAWAKEQKPALEREERRDDLIGKILSGSEYDQAQAKKELAQMDRQDSYSDLTERSKSNDIDGRMAQQELQRRKQEEQLRVAYAAQMAKSRAEAAKPSINYQSTPSDVTMRGYGVPDYGNSPYDYGYSPYAQQQSSSYTGNACGYEESMNSNDALSNTTIIPNSTNPEPLDGLKTTAGALLLEIYKMKQGTDDGNDILGYAGDKAYKNVQAINQMIDDPVGTYNAIKDGAVNAATHPIDTLSNMASNIENKIQEFKDGSPEVKKKILGDLFGDGASLFASEGEVINAMKGLAAAGKEAAATGKNLFSLVTPEGVRITAGVEDSGIRVIKSEAKEGGSVEGSAAQGAGKAAGVSEANLKNIDDFINGNKKFDEVIEDYAKVYKKHVDSNKPWSWDDSIPGGDSLSSAQKRKIKEMAIAEGHIPEIKVTKVDGMKYGFADFAGAGVVEETIQLPEKFWKLSDKEQFKGLDEQIGGTRQGMTWHHTEVPGKMELVPFGIHNITPHNGGRSVGMWADAPR